MARIINHPKEPAHPMVIALHENLVELYKFIREKYQTKIDDAFDNVSRQIGFVVTTTIPVDIEIGEKGKLKGVTVAADNLKGTLFESIPAVLKTGEVVADRIPAGKYQIYLLWYPALKLKLRTDFMEPAHVGVSFAGKSAIQRLIGSGEPVHPPYSDWGEILTSLRSELAARFAGKIPFYGEPVHWLDPGYQIVAEEAVLIHAIDEVYPELRLADRISAARQELRQKIRPEIPEPAHPYLAFRPGVREPAHLAQLDKALSSEKGQEIAAEFIAILRRYGY